MVQCETLCVFLCLMGLLSETLCSLTLEAEAGDKITIWCQHELTLTGSIFWFKHTSGSVPSLLGCKKFKASGSSPKCYFFTESERIVMSIYGKNTSLTIKAVNVSDTGLYYCSFGDEMIFSNSISLLVKDESKTSKNLDKPEGCVCTDSDLFFWINVGFGVAIVIVLSFLILKHRTTHTGAEGDNKEKKPERRRDELEYSYVVYSSVSQ